MTAAVTTFLFNAVMLGIAGEDGVAAVTVLIYSQFMVSSVFFGPLLAKYRFSASR